MTTTAKKQISTHAHVAKRIREFARDLGVKCKARSESYSMGSSVSWRVDDLHPDIFQKIDEFAKDHVYGHFNGMEDIYESSNSRDDIPQVKYIFSNNDFSDEIKEKAFQWLYRS